MTKRQNKVYYISMVFCGILEVLALIGAYAANYYTKTRMGMLRHVVYLNNKWEKALPITSIKWIAICIIIALVILVYLRYRKQNNHGKVIAAAALLTITISSWTVYFMLYYSTARNRAYYILSVCFMLAVVFQNILYYCISSFKTRK